MAAVDFFLKIDGIPGESTSAKMDGAIDIESFSWGVTNSSRAIGTAAGGGGGAGKASFQDLHFTTSVSKASPVLMLACATGKHLKEATLTGRLNQKVQLDFFTVKLTDLLVSSYQSGGSGGGEVLPQDQFTLNFSKIEFDYKPQSDTGALLEPVVAPFDLQKNLLT
jgi:type VI secretion system secreted protein Hcp